MTKHLTEELPWPGDVNPDVSENVCRLIEKMMAKDREERYETPEELITDLELVTDGKAPESEMPAAGHGSIGRRGTAGARSGARPKSRRMREDAGTAGTAGRLLEPVAKKRLPRPVLCAIGAGILLLLGVGIWTLTRGNGQPDEGRIAAEKAWAEQILPGVKDDLSREEAMTLRNALAAFGTRHGETDFARGKAGEVGRLKARVEAALAGPARPPPSGDKKFREMYAYADGWWKKNPGEYQEAVAKFKKVMATGRGTRWELQAGDAITEIKTARSKAADAAFSPLHEKAAKLASGGDFDAAIAVYGQPPAKFANFLKPRFEGERRKLKQQAETRLTAAIAAAEGFGKDGRPEKGLAELDKVKSVKYAALADRLAALSARLKKESADVAGKLAKQKEAEARKVLEGVLARYDELMLAGKWKEAAGRLAAEKKKLKKDVLAAMPLSLAAAEKIAGQLVSWQAGCKDALGKLPGKDIVLRTRVGAPTRGKILKVTDDAFEVKVSFRIGGTVGTSTRTVRFADLAAGELEKLRPSFKPVGADGHLAAVLLALGEKDYAAAREALAAAGGHVLASRYAEKIDRAEKGNAEVNAEKAWQADVAPLLKEEYDLRGAKAVLAALGVYAGEHGKAKFFAAQKAETEKIRRLAQAALDASPEGLVGRVKKLFHGKVTSFDPKTLEVEVLYAFEDPAEADDWIRAVAIPEAPGGMRMRGGRGRYSAHWFAPLKTKALAFDARIDPPPKPTMTPRAWWSAGGASGLLARTGAELHGVKKRTGTAALTFGRDHSMKIAFRDGSASWSIDGAAPLVVKVKASAPVDKLALGMLGVGGGVSTIRFDNVRVRGVLDRKWIESELAALSRRKRAPRAAFRAEWRKLACTGDNPPRRAGGQSAMAYDSKRKRCVVFGGGGIAPYHNGIWALDVARAKTFVLQKNDPKNPAAGKSLPLGPHPGNGLRFEYDSGADRYWNGWEWSWDPNTGRWTKHEGRFAGAKPPRGPRMGWRYDPDGRRFMAWADGKCAFVWPLTGKVEPLRAGPYGRYIGGGLIYDRKNKVFVLFGGVPYARQGDNDTWVLDPKTKSWRMARPAVSPPPQIFHSLVWHKRLGAVVLVGSTVRKDKPELTDLWVWETDAERWTEVRTRTSPPPGNQGTAYDEASDAVVRMAKDQIWVLKIARSR